MILYHGTGICFKEIDLSKSKDKRDFGKGFYTTTIFEQAEKWAKNQYLRYGTTGSFVKEYEYVSAVNLKIKVFDGMNKKWLEFVKRCRTEGGTPHDYDIIQGPVANDNTMRTGQTHVKIFCFKSLNYYLKNAQNGKIPLGWNYAFKRKSGRNRRF